MFKSIVVPVDVSDLKVAHLAIHSAVKLADPIGASLTLVHVVPIMPLMMLDTVPVSFEGEVAEKAKSTLADLGRAIDLPGGSVSTVVRIGGVYHEVLAIAEEQRADLIVVGSHQPSVATYLLGSNASAIVRHAPCSIMVVREERQPALGASLRADNDAAQARAARPMQ
ncbi:universal stress protein [Labrys monachus]|uniref:Nucleotide-binding universal stress UspA family protein n=1 Tax=Labrys monachus TaxID=217067 RepID=A0ABU0FKM1_9HYPH|nr:universal stress protein [Labrys monachus]MDQ0395155.1 nucleotide-binding universal stress UspA family protein [Labrys monachus]